MAKIQYFPMENALCHSGSMPAVPSTNAQTFTFLYLAMMLRVVGPAWQQPGLCALRAGDFSLGLQFFWDGDAD